MRGRGIAPLASLAVVGAFVATAFASPVVAVVDPSPTSVTVTKSGSFVGGQEVTLTPVYTPAFPDGFEQPATTVCSWELLWGDEDSLVNQHFDETFGSLLVRGKGSDGFCGPWTFTVPFSASGRWEYAFTYQDTTTFVNTPYTFTTGSNAVAAGGVTTSNLPGVWLSMPHGTRQGDLVTVTAHPFGGYTMPPNGAHWDAYDGCNCHQYFARHDGPELTWTFRAAVAGTIAVFYNDSGTPEYGGPNFAGAGIDPRIVTVKVRANVPSIVHRSVWFGVSATPSGFVGAVRYVWFRDGVRVFTGRSGRIRFMTTGSHRIKVIALDGHGHKAQQVVWRTVRA